MHCNRSHDPDSQLPPALPTSGDTTLAELEPLVINALRQRLEDRPTLGKVLYETRFLFEFFKLRKVKRIKDVTTALVTEWIWDARLNRSNNFYRPAHGTAKNRQSIALSVFVEAAQLGAPINPLGLIGERIQRPAKAVPIRPLTDDELHLVEVHSDIGILGLSRRPLLVAFAKAGGNSGAISAVRVSDIDLDAGTVTFRREAGRVGPLDDWGKRVVRGFFDSSPLLAADDLVCHTRKIKPSNAIASVTQRLRFVLTDAGLMGLPGVAVRSIRFAAARHVFEAQGIEAAARFLGSRSLDVAAESVGYDWRSDHA